MNFDEPKKFISHLRQRFTQASQRLNLRLQGWPALILQASGEVLKSESTITAAAIAYFALFSLFPLILVSIIIASFNLTTLLDQAVILNKLEFIAPDLGQLLGPNIDEIIRMRGAVTIVALIGLVWSASTVFNVLNQTMGHLWGYRRPRPLWEQRGLAILAVLVLAGPVLALVSFASSLLATFYSLLPMQSILLASLTSLLVALLLNISLFFLLYLVFPHGTATWRELLPGAISAGLLWELAKQAFLLFISSYLSASNLVYGSVTAIIAFLTWAYLSGLIFLFGAHLIHAYYERRKAEH